MLVPHTIYFCFSLHIEALANKKKSFSTGIKVYITNKIEKPEWDTHKKNGQLFQRESENTQWEKSIIIKWHKVINIDTKTKIKVDLFNTTQLTQNR